MEFRFISQIAAVDASSWDQLHDGHYPFVRHAFLAALEGTGCVQADRGWTPHHLLAYEQGTLVAALPGYIKSHSYGEYVFDWSWADAYHRYGYDYYPKLINAVPFTPCTGPRLLCRAEIPVGALMQTLQQELARLSLSGWHCLFPTERESRTWREAGSLQRIGCQFHWFNRDYRDFDGFLERMTSRKRKSIKRERREVLEQGIRFEWYENARIDPAICRRFYQLYQTTYLKRSGHRGYLTEDFFVTLGQTMPDNLLIVEAVAQASGEVLAAAFFLRDQRTLYGRYWGCFDEFQFLHFETCYYQGIDYAIDRGLERFDGGAQGEHKIQRGFEPVLTYSNHWLEDAPFRDAIGRALGDEAEHIKAYQRDALGYLPFKENSLAQQESGA